MYLDLASIADCERRFGLPAEAAVDAPMRPDEMDRLVASRRHDRAHDVTFFILDDAGRVVVIRKPLFPPGCWRPPSGGAQPGEGLEAGAVREAREETGLEVALVRYVLRMRARCLERLATDGGEAPTGRVVLWTSHVFTARTRGGRLAPIDTDEIAAARWAPLEELAGPIRAALLASGSWGLRYRAALHDAVLARLG